MFEYSEKILKSKIPACNALTDAIKRSEKDFERENWNWVFKKELAQKVINFMELLPEPKTRKPQPLADFQKFIIGSLYGWVDRDNNDIKRFTNAFISMARKNGKSLLISGIIIYEFLFGRDPANHRQLYCAANDRKQAGIVFEMVKERLEALRLIDYKVAKCVQIRRNDILNLNDGSIIRPFSRNAGLVNGFEPHVAVVDEYADAKTTDMLKTLSSGQVLLPSFLTLIISTAGFDMNVPMRVNNYPYAKKILSGEVKNDRYFVFIAEQDTVKEVNNPALWIKSNPILGVASIKKQVETNLRETLEQSRGEGTLNSTLVKNFNIWRQATEDSYLSVEDWNNSELQEKPSIQGKRVWFGVDVGSTSDLFAISWLVPQDSFTWLDSYAFVSSKHGLQEKIKTDRIDYEAAEKAGECEIIRLNSGVIDPDTAYFWLENFIKENQLDVQGIMYDVYQFGPLLSKIEQFHPEWPLIQITQGTRTLSMPTKQFRDDVIAKKILHSDNRVLRAAAMNAVLMTDNNGVRINKNVASNKIDMIDATLDAYAIFMTAEVTPTLTKEEVFSDDFGF